MPLPHPAPRLNCSNCVVVPHSAESGAVSRHCFFFKTCFFQSFRINNLIHNIEKYIVLKMCLVDDIIAVLLLSWELRPLITGAQHPLAPT